MAKISMTALKYNLEKACQYAMKEFDLVIAPGDFGVKGQTPHPSGGGCCCPIGALELYTKEPRNTFDFNYDAFVDGFDSDLAWEDVEGGYREPEEIELFKLGHEFRKQYVKEAA